MKGKKKKVKSEKTLTEQELLKYEIAKELGLWEKIQKHGWGELTAEESGRIGGIMARRNKNTVLLHDDR